MSSQNLPAGYVYEGEEKSIKRRKLPHFNEAHVWEEVEVHNDTKSVKVYYDFNDPDRKVFVEPGESKIIHRLKQLKSEYYIERKK